MELITYCHICDSLTDQENGVCLDCKEMYETLYDANKKNKKPVSFKAIGYVHDLEFQGVPNQEPPPNPGTGPPLTIKVLNEAVAKIKNMGELPDYLGLPPKFSIGVKPQVPDSVAHPAHQCSRETCWCHTSPWYRDKPVVEV